MSSIHKLKQKIQHRFTHEIIFNRFANSWTGKVCDLQHCRLGATTDFSLEGVWPARTSTVTAPKGSSQTSSPFGDFGNCPECQGLLSGVSSSSSSSSSSLGTVQPGQVSYCADTPDPPSSTRSRSAGMDKVMGVHGWGQPSLEHPKNTCPQHPGCCHWDTSGCFAFCRG